MSKIKITLSEFVSIELEESSALNFDSLDISPLIDEIVRGAKELAVIRPSMVPSSLALPSQSSQSVKPAGKVKGPFERAYNATIGKLVLNGEFDGMEREAGARAKWLTQVNPSTGAKYTEEQHAAAVASLPALDDGIAIVMPQTSANDSADEIDFDDIPE